RKLLVAHDRAAEFLHHGQGAILGLVGANTADHAKYEQQRRGESETTHCRPLGAFFQPAAMCGKPWQNMILQTSAEHLLANWERVGQSGVEMNELRTDSQKSGIRESNPSHSLGKAGHSRYTNPAETSLNLVSAQKECKRKVGMVNAARLQRDS